MPDRSRVVYSSLQAAVMELNSCNRDQVAHKAPIPQKCLLTLDPEA